MKKSLANSKQKRTEFSDGEDVRRARGGARPGAGRPADWLKAKCRDIVNKEQLVEFLGKVAGGRNVDVSVTETGIRVSVPAKMRDRLFATTDLLDRGYGKPNQTIEINFNFATVIIAQVNRALHKVPDACPHCHTKLGIRREVGEELLELSKRLEQGSLE